MRSCLLFVALFVSEVVLPGFRSGLCVWWVGVCVCGRNPVRSEAILHSAPSPSPSLDVGDFFSARVWPQITCFMLHRVADRVTPTVYPLTQPSFHPALISDPLSPSTSPSLSPSRPPLAPHPYRPSTRTLTAPSRLSRTALCPICPRPAFGALVPLRLSDCPTVPTARRVCHQTEPSVIDLCAA